MELFEEISGNSNSCLTFDPVEKVIYLRKWIMNENDPDDHLGGEFVKKTLPKGKKFEEMTINSNEFKFIIKMVSQHSHFDDIDIKAFKLKLEMALDSLVVQYMSWLEGAEERREQEKREAEAEAQLEMEMIAAEGDDIIDSMKHPLICIAWMIDWCTAGERLNILYSFLAYASQVVLKNPISVIGIGDGGSGKTHIQDVALSMIPDEYVMTVKSTTDAALFGFCDTDPYIFDGKIVNIGDMGGKNDHEEAQNFKNAMKELQSDGYMSRIKRDPDVLNGGWINKTYELFGNPCITYTNVPGYEFEDQEKSRSIFYQPRTDNDEAVMVFKTLSRMKGTPTADILKREQKKILDIKKMLIALRRNMEFTHIYNPYNDFVRKYLGKSKYFKRDVDKYDGILRIITAINGYRRPLVNDTLLTTKEDIVMFLDILERYHESIRSNLSPGAADILQELNDHAESWDLYESGLTVGDYLYKTTNAPAKKSVQKYFRELNQEGYIKAVGKDGNANIYVLVNASGDSLKDEIELSELDKKILKFNYDYDAAMNILTTHAIPLDIFSTSIPEPVWNDYLPKKE